MHVCADSRSCSALFSLATFWAAYTRPWSTDTGPLRLSSAQKRCAIFHATFCGGVRPPIIDLCWPSSFVQRAKEEETWDSSEIYSPWCARAIAPYPAPGQRTHPSDLQFEAGDLISLTSKHCDEWWTGYKVLPSGTRAHGTFPRKLVKILPPDSKDHEVANRGGVNSNSQVGDGSGGWTTGTRKQRPPTANSRGAAASDERRPRRQIETAATPRSIIGSGVGALTVPEDQAELAVLFRIWDPDGSRELRRHELQGAVQSLWRQFNHPLAFDRAARCVSILSVPKQPRTTLYRDLSCLAYKSRAVTRHIGRCN